MELLKAMLRFRDKFGSDSKDMYKQCLPHPQVFTTDDALREIYHCLHSNECESMNRMITKFCPKVKTLCQTLSNKGQTYMSIGLDSVGYTSYFSCLFKLLGLEEVYTVATEHHKTLYKAKLTRS
jgi:hypothetical protein